MSNLSLEQLMLKDIQIKITQIESMLNSAGIKMELRNLEEAIKALSKLKFLKQNEHYAGIFTDKNGYIVAAMKINDFAELAKVPKDVSKGYYKLEKGEFVLDEKRRRHLSEV